MTNSYVDRIKKGYYYNYHRHDCHSNIILPDSSIKIEDYCKRAVELGHDTVFTTNHGFQGNIFDTLSLCDEYNLKMIIGVESYFVENRFEKDRSNKHIVIIALNNEGVKDINRITSGAWVSGFYYRPRIDRELLFSLNPKNVVVTTACVAGVWQNEDLIKKCHEYFKDNFFLEVQNHNQDIQKKVNKEVLRLSIKYNIKIIHGNDSHYIYPEEEYYRNLLKKAKAPKIAIEEDDFGEDSFILDYPEIKTIISRYIKQGVLSKNQIIEAITSTYIFDKCEKITMYNKDIKLPEVSNNPNQDLRRIIAKSWSEYRNLIPKKKEITYLKAIKEELDIIEKTNMANYFLIDYHVTDIAENKYGGRLTNTGRGSAPSFITTKFLGLTEIDRIDSPVTLYPSRFMSVERILGARSLPDIDLNTTDKEPFIKATEDLLGKENCAWMISWKPYQEASAFNLVCRGLGMQPSEYENVSQHLDDYKDSDKWRKIIETSKHFIGVVESISPSPCSMLLYDKPVNEEIGLIRIQDKKTKNIQYCCLLDGYNCDKYKYLKNDYLVVQIWAIIQKTCKLAGIEIPTIREMNELLDYKTWEIYEKGLTCTINQADSDYATPLVMTYKPKSIAELSAFVAIIRPGCASLLNDFIHRKDYTTGVPELDNLLSEGSNRMIYQELIMKYLIWLGVKESGSYDIIKKISKKKFSDEALEELRSKLLISWVNILNTEDNFQKNWKVVNDAAKYSFNASHSLSYAYDSAYGAYLKSHYPLEYYSVVLEHYSDDQVRTGKLTKELSYFNIKLKPIKFGKSKYIYMPDKNTNSIYKGICSVKFCNEKIADELYEISKNRYENFISLLKDIGDKTSVNAKQLRILIGLNFFSEFGKNEYLNDICEIYNKFSKVKQINKSKLEELYLGEFLIKKYSNKETKSLFKEIDNIGLINELVKDLKPREKMIADQIKFDIDYMGYTDYKNLNMSTDLYVVTVFEIGKNPTTPRIVIRNLNNGIETRTRIKRGTHFRESPFKEFSVLKINKLDDEFKRRPNAEGKWVEIDETEKILNDYEVIKL